MPSRIFFGHNSGPPTEAAAAASTLPKLTSAAVAVEHPDAAGASTLPPLTSAAVAVMHPAAAGASTLPPLTSAGVAAQLSAEAAAASSMPPLTAAGVAVEHPDAAGASTLPMLTSSGVALMHPDAAAASTMPMLRAAGVATHVTPTIPSPQRVRYGYIMQPSVTYDGTGLANRIIPIGVDADGGDLTLEWADPSPMPYAIQSDGDSWYIQDSASINNHGLFEQKVYRTDIRVPETHTNPATGLTGQPLGQDQEFLTIGAVATAGDTLTLGGRAYTFVAGTPAAGADEISVGTDAKDQMDDIVLAVLGADGYNSANADVTVDGTPRLNASGDWVALLAKNTATQECAGTTTGGVAKGTDVPIGETFTSADNYLGGGIVDTDPPTTSPPATAPTVLSGGDLGELTANVLYWSAVNMLLKGRSEFIGFRCIVANGADIWALPGDRMHVRYEGWADTEEAEFYNGDPRVTWLSIDDAMVIVQRHDRSDPSGVRQVEFVLARPELAYTIPAVPTWPSDDPSGDSPESLPVPGGRDGFGDGTSPGLNTMPDYLGDTLPKIIEGNGLPFGSSNCCPCSPTEVTTGTGLGPPQNLTEADPQIAAGLAIFSVDPASSTTYTSGRWLVVAHSGPDGGGVLDEPAPPAGGVYPGYSKTLQFEKLLDIVMNTEKRLTVWLSDPFDSWMVSDGAGGDPVNFLRQWTDTSNSGGHLYYLEQSTVIEAITTHWGSGTSLSGAVDIPRGHTGFSIVERQPNLPYTTGATPTGDWSAVAHSAFIDPGAFAVGPQTSFGWTWAADGTAADVALALVFNMRPGTA